MILTIIVIANSIKTYSRILFYAMMFYLSKEKSKMQLYNIQK